MAMRSRLHLKGAFCKHILIMTLAPRCHKIWLVKQCMLYSNRAMWEHGMYLHIWHDECYSLNTYHMRQTSSHTHAAPMPRGSYQWHACPACFYCMFLLSPLSALNLLTHSILRQIRDSRGKKVGRCKEWAKVVGDDKVDERILAMRHGALPSLLKAAKATQPERVLTYRSAGLLCRTALLPVVRTTWTSGISLVTSLQSHP